MRCESQRRTKWFSATVVLKWNKQIVIKNKIMNEQLSM